jgi:hypothetical protein
VSEELIGTRKRARKRRSSLCIFLERWREAAEKVTTLSTVRSLARVVDISVSTVCHQFLSQTIYRRKNKAARTATTRQYTGSEKKPDELRGSETEDNRRGMAGRGRRRQGDRHFFKI